MKNSLLYLSTHAMFASESIQEFTPLAKQGYCNQNYLLTTQKSHYVVRVFGAEPRDRALEYTIQSRAYAQGIAPKPLLLDIENNLMIMTFAAGEHRKKLTLAELKNLAKALITLHSIKHHASQITLDIDTTILNTFDYDPILCHNDLNPQNILWHHNNPTLIDWEYAGENDRYFDLASVVVEFGLDTAKLEAFLAAYFQQKRWNPKKLDTYITLYKAVCQKWWDDRAKDT